MVTITEDYVSFETAKLLKEKGFNEPCLKQYYNNGELSNVSIEAKYNTIDNQVSAPTLQMAMKWLREVHSATIIIDTNDRWLGEGNRFYWWRIYYKMGGRIEKKWYSDPSKPTDILRYQTYEEACEAAIKYCLEDLNLNNYGN